MKEKTKLRVIQILCIVSLIITVLAPLLIASLIYLVLLVVDIKTEL